MLFVSSLVFIITKDRFRGMVMNSQADASSGIGRIQAASHFLALPLMLIIVFTIPSVLIGVTIGLLLGAASNFGRAHRGLAVGATIGLFCGEVILSFILPWLMARI